MKDITTIVLVLSLASALPACAAAPPTDEHAAHHPAAAADAPKAPSATENRTSDAMPMQRMHDNAQKMQELMAKVHAAKDPAERRRLLEQHHQAINEQFKMMRGMMGRPGMQHGAMQGGRQPGADKQDSQAGAGAMQGGMMGEMMMQRQRMMNERMDMMQMMMEQMMEHMSAEHGMHAAHAEKKK